MLAACLVLGVSVSSFVYRRQPYDSFQGLVFLLLVVWAVFLGRGMGASANLILLAYVPWAVCVAMLLSYLGHSLARLVRQRAVGGRNQAEKREVLD